MQLSVKRGTYAITLCSLRYELHVSKIENLTKLQVSIATIFTFRKSTISQSGKLFYRFHAVLIGLHVRGSFKPLPHTISSANRQGRCP